MSYSGENHPHIVQCELTMLGPPEAMPIMGGGAVISMISSGLQNIISIVSSKPLNLWDSILAF